MANNATLNLDPLFFLGSIRRLFDKAEQPLTNSYRQHPYVYAAVKAIAQSIAAVPFKIWKDEEFKSPVARKQFAKEVYKLENFKGMDAIKNQIIREYGRKRYHKILEAYQKKDFKTVNKLAGFEQQKNGPLVDLFDNPGGATGQEVGFTHWMSTVGYFIQDGAAFWVLRGKRTRSELPKAIEVYGPTGWKALVNNKGRKITGWEFTYNNAAGKPEKEVFKPWQVICFKNWNPNKELEALPWHRPAILAIEQDHEASIYNRAFFKNGAEAGVVLETEQKLNRDQRNAIIESWNQRHQGARHAHKPVMLDGGLKARLMRGSHRDMEYHLLKGVTRDEILAVHQTPKAIVGVIEDVNRASFLGSKRTFFELALIPLMEYISQVVYTQLILPVDATLFGFFDLALVEGLRGDISEKADVATKYHGMGVPFDTINERFDLGFPTIPFGDIGFFGGHTVEQVATGATLSIGDNQFSPDAGTGVPDEDEDGQAQQSDDQADLNNDEKDFQDLFSINEFLVAKKLINGINHDVEDYEPLVTDICNIICSSFSNKYGRVDLDFEYKEYIWSVLDTFIAKNLPINTENRLKMAIFYRKTAKFGRILTTKVVNECKLNYALLTNKTTKTWLVCKNCHEKGLETPKESIPLVDPFSEDCQYPNEWLKRQDCQCSIKVN